MSDHSGQFYFNPFDPDFRADPYPAYAALRDGPPKQLNLFLPITLIARYADALHVLRDHATFSSVRPDVPGRDLIDPFRGTATIITSDPPVQTRLRRLLSRAFAPARIREMEPQIRAITSELLEDSGRDGTFEVVKTLADPLPVRVIAEMLGVPRERQHQFKQWSDAIIASLAVLPGTPLPQESIDAANALRAFFGKEIETRRQTPGTDLISGLLVAHDERGALSLDELLAFVILLLIAGNETTTNLIGNGLLTLGRNRDQMARLRDHPELIATAIEEIIRYESPIHSITRMAVRDTNVGGTDIRAGGIVMVVLAAANRDPLRFRDADTFDIARSPNDHLGFGEGIHYCLGAPLGRLEAAIAIGTMLERFPNLRLSDPEPPLTFKGALSMRGVVSLPMLT